MTKAQTNAVAILKASGLSFDVDIKADRLLIYKNGFIWKDYILSTFNKDMMDDLQRNLSGE